MNNRGLKKMEPFWLRFRCAYDFAYDSYFWFSQGHKRSYDPAYDSGSDFVASENPWFQIICKLYGL